MLEAEIKRTARDCAESLRRYAFALEEFRQKAYADDPLLAVAVWNARLTDPGVGWLDVAAEREKRRGGESDSDG